MEHWSITTVPNLAPSVFRTWVGVGSVWDGVLYLYCTVHPSGIRHERSYEYDLLRFFHNNHNSSLLTLTSLTLNLRSLSRSLSLSLSLSTDSHSHSRSLHLRKVAHLPATCHLPPSPYNLLLRVASVGLSLYSLPSYIHTPPNW